MSYEFTGDFTVATSREDAFAVLSRPERFAPMLPTYVSHEIQDDGSAAVKVKVGVGKVRGTGNVQLTLVECEEPVRATYSGKGKIMGGAFNLNAGFVLEELGPESTRVDWRGEMSMFGKLVSLAGGVVKPVAERDIGKLIEALQSEMGGAPAEAPAEAAVETPAEERKPGMLARFVAWLKGLFGGGA
ncbi:CoxG family protein [Elongatibacter sediminis]|uniref:SRPBCC domain-containing protein n=1 Tax=Elongatibacter sediminis TaxID=3119006 RepID=A0AAW9RJ19_9GAMM